MAPIDLLRPLFHLQRLALILILVAGPAAAGPEAPLEVEVAPLQPAARVGEPIRFEARANRPCYLYLYATDPATGATTLLVPNRRQPDNRLSGGVPLSVPGPEVAYVAATPGTRQVTAVSSTRPLEVTTQAGPDGDFPLLSVKDLDATFGTTGIGAGSGYLRIGSDELKVSRFEVRVAAATQAAPPSPRDAAAGAQGIAFVAAAGNRLRVGETLRIVFGADRQGWVHLLVIDPNGTRTPLTKRETDGRSVLSVETQAAAPAGDHLLVAVYTPGPDLDERVLEALREGPQDKGLRLVPDSLPGALATQRIAILP